MLNEEKLKRIIEGLAGEQVDEARNIATITLRVPAGLSPEAVAGLVRSALEQQAHKVAGNPGYSAALLGVADSIRVKSGGAGVYDKVEEAVLSGEEDRGAEGKTRWVVRRQYRWVSGITQDSVGSFETREDAERVAALLGRLDTKRQLKGYSLSVVEEPENDYWETEVNRKDEGADPHGKDRHCPTCRCDKKKAIWRETGDSKDPYGHDRHCPTCLCAGKPGKGKVEEAGKQSGAERRMERFYQSHVGDPDVWPKGYRQTEEWFLRIYDNYADAWLSEKGRELTEPERDALNSMVWNGIF